MDKKETIKDILLEVEKNQKETGKDYYFDGDLNCFIEN